MTTAPATVCSRAGPKRLPRARLEARISKQTLYVYYPSKAELFAAVLRAAAAAGLARPTDPENAATLLVGALVLRLVRDGLLAPPGGAVPPSPEQLDEAVEQFLLGVAPRSKSAPPRAGGTPRQSPSVRRWR